MDDEAAEGPTRHRKIPRIIEDDDDDTVIEVPLDSPAPVPVPLPAPSKQPTPPLQSSSKTSTAAVFYSLLDVLQMLMVMEVNTVNVIDSCLRLAGQALTLTFDKKVLALHQTLLSCIDRFVDNYMLLEDINSQDKIDLLKNMT